MVCSKLTKLQVLKNNILWKKGLKALNKTYWCIKQKPARISLRRKEVTPEYLRLGLPLDQARHDEERKILLTERKKEYNEILSKVLEFG